ncbi:unnamed protein product, partial [Vitis vinifera]
MDWSLIAFPNSRFTDPSDPWCFSLAFFRPDKTSKQRKYWN